MNKLLKRIEDAEKGIKDLDAEKGVITGYFAAFGNKDSDGDIIIKGAFAKTIAEIGPGSRKPRIKHCLDHRLNQGVGCLQLLKEDDYGLYYESKIGTHTLGQDYMKMCQEKIITEHSIGYWTVKGEPDQVNNAYRLLELGLYEGSGLQFWGANPETPITGFKADDITTERDYIALFNLLEKALKTGTYSDETFSTLIEPNYKKLGDYLRQTKRNTEPDADSTQPDARVGLPKPGDVKSLFSFN